MLLTFRTMTAARDEAGELLPDDQRMTPLGRFLRRSSPDELPAIVRTESSPEFDEECPRHPNGKVTLTFWRRMFGAPAFPDAGKRLHRIVADGGQ
jgi:Bacterial sugar transferase